MSALASAMGGARATSDEWRDRYRTPRGVIDHVHRVLGSIALDAQRRGYDALVTEILLRELDRTNPRGNGNGVIQ